MTGTKVLITSLMGLIQFEDLQGVRPRAAIGCPAWDHLFLLYWLLFAAQLSVGIKPMLQESAYAVSMDSSLPVTRHKKSGEVRHQAV
jgi:hypothetical protein